MANLLAYIRACSELPEVHLLGRVVKLKATSLNQGV